MGSEGTPRRSVQQVKRSPGAKRQDVPLLIDPQLQGNRWIREMEKENKDRFVILDPLTDNYIKTIEMSVANGNIVLLQNLDE